MHDENKISCLSSDHLQDMKKNILYLKKTIKMAEEEKNPKTNFRRLNFFDVC